MFINPVRRATHPQSQDHRQEHELGCHLSFSGHITTAKNPMSVPMKQNSPHNKLSSNNVQYQHKNIFNVFALRQIFQPLVLPHWPSICIFMGL